MSELYFRAGETEGFTSKKLADKKVVTPILLGNYCKIV